jgi:hypothetical protein
VREAKKSAHKFLGAFFAFKILKKIRFQKIFAEKQFVHNL